MWLVLRKLAPGIVLIMVACGVLVVSDVKRRGPGGEVRTEAAPGAAASQGAAVGRVVPGKKADAPAGATGRLTKKWDVALVCYVDSPPSEDTVRGVKDGLTEAGLAEGRDYTLRPSNAQGDMATLNSIMTAVRSRGVDMVITVSTPTLQTALKQFDRTPIIFSCVASGVQAGAGRSETDHRPNVTGITTLSPFKEMAELLPECLPGIRRVGTLFTPSEVNSVLYKDRLEQALKAKGITLVAVPANTSSEITDAASALCAKDVGAICQLSDNLTAAAFSSLAMQAGKAGMAIFSFSSAQAYRGGMLAMARDYYDGGRETGLLAARVMRGESPADIPFANVRTMRLIINLARAQQLGLTIPAFILSRADEVIK